MKDQRKKAADDLLLCLACRQAGRGGGDFIIYFIHSHTSRYTWVILYVWIWELFGSPATGAKQAWQLDQLKYERERTLLGGQLSFANVSKCIPELLLCDDAICHLLPKNEGPMGRSVVSSKEFQLCCKKLDTKQNIRYIEFTLHHRQPKRATWVAAASMSFSADATSSTAQAAFE